MQGIRNAKIIGGVNMGGGGGKYWGSRSKSDEEFESLVKQAASSSQASHVEIDINVFLENLLKELNDRDVIAIQKHLNEIMKALGKEIDGVENILFGGSISKSTFIEGLSDVDALVFLNQSYLHDADPQKLQNIFYELLKKRFPCTEVKKGRLAVTVKFKDYEVQLLPAIKDGKMVHIASIDKSGWSLPIDTNAFSDRLTQINKNHGGKVIPVIKLTKQILNNIPNEYKLSGYHIETLAAEGFLHYDGRENLFEMTKHLLKFAEARVKTKMADVTGQSKIVDEYLGENNSLKRQYLSKYIRSLESRFQNSTATTIGEVLFN